MELQPLIEKTLGESGAIVENPLANPFKARTRYGWVVGGSDQGSELLGKNKDRLVLTENGAVLLDGMNGTEKSRLLGRYLHGERAAQSGAEVFLEDLRTGKDFHEIQIDAHHALEKLKLAENGFSWVGFRLVEVNGKLVLRPAGAGDGTIFIIRGDVVIVVTELERSWFEGKEYVDNAVTGEDPGETRIYPEVVLQNGDQIVALTDGIGDNRTPEEIAAMIKGKTTDEAFRVVTADNIQRMLSGNPDTKPDNRSLMIWDIKTLG